MGEGYVDTCLFCHFSVSSVSYRCLIFFSFCWPQLTWRRKMWQTIRITKNLPWVWWTWCFAAGFFFRRGEDAAHSRNHPPKHETSWMAVPPNQHWALLTTPRQWAWHKDTLDNRCILKKWSLKYEEGCRDNRKLCKLSKFFLSCYSG